MKTLDRAPWAGIGSRVIIRKAGTFFNCQGIVLRFTQGSGEDAAVDHLNEIEVEYIGNDGQLHRTNTMFLNSNLVWVGNCVTELRNAAEEATDWLCDCEPGTDQYERGRRLRRAVNNFDGLTR